MNDTQQELINIIAFVPTQEEIRKIMATGDEVDSAISFIEKKSVFNDSLQKDNLKTALKIDLKKLSKIPNVPVLAPPSLDPNETILAKLASGKIGPGAKVREGVVDADGGELTIIGDGNGLFYPLAGQDGAKRSNGPNAVYIPGQGKRINLFSSRGLKVSPSELLTRYINFRDQNIGGIIGLTIDMINKPGGRGKLEDYGDKAGAMELIASLLGKLQDVKTKEDLNAVGMDIVSFCQTWDPETGHANFSVMSPHFQNRLYITDSEKLKTKGVSQEEIDAFNNALASMTADDAFLGAYANPPRFINLDGLNKTGSLSVSIGGKKQRTRKNKNNKHGKKTRKLNKNGGKTKKLNKKGGKTRKLNKKGKKGKKTMRRS